MTAAANYPHVGQRVLCIDGDFGAIVFAPGVVPPKTGARYTIGGLYYCPHCGTGPGLNLAEIPSAPKSDAQCSVCKKPTPDTAGGWRANRFRPLDDGEEHTEAGYKAILGALDELPWLGRPREPVEEPQRIRERPGTFVMGPRPDLAAIIQNPFPHIGDPRPLTNGEAEVVLAWIQRMTKPGRT